MVKNKSVNLNEDFTCLKCGHNYGTNSGEIYRVCCYPDTLGWDKNKEDMFGKKDTPLHAEKCDKWGNSVWFLSYCVWEKRGFHTTHDGEHINEVVGDGEKIIERAAEHGSAADKVRITFVKTNTGYEFLGVYQLVKNGKERTFERISEIYPMK